LRPLTTPQYVHLRSSNCQESSTIGREAHLLPENYYVDPGLPKSSIAPFA
jgi:hypothetical protein